MNSESRLARFERTVLAHLGAAYNLARWLVGEEAGAEDAVQEASLKALRFFDDCEGTATRAWFMAIVRNACYDWLRERRPQALEVEFDDEQHGAALQAESPEAIVSRQSDARWVRAGIAALPVEFREVVVLRELEGLTYKEISAIVKIPIGTVMSRLARGRDLLARALAAQSHRRPA
jgi:RNA polymerase sigma-70 factor (ECF subfamily)